MVRAKPLLKFFKKKTGLKWFHSEAYYAGRPSERKHT